MQLPTQPAGVLERLQRSIEQAADQLTQAADELRAYRCAMTRGGRRIVYTSAPNARFVTIELAAALTGFSRRAIETKIYRGQWLEGQVWIRRDGRIIIDMQGYEVWASGGTI